MKRLRSERGQATVEFVGTLPLVLLAGLLAWQLVLVGHVAWDAAAAARSGARARLVGADAAAAARSALPSPLRSGTRVQSSLAGGTVRVSVPIPLVLYRWRLPVRMSAAASLGR
jgi:TadE-like protein